MEIQTLSLDEWDELLPPSGFEPFHTPEALSVMERYAEGELRLLGGFRGQQSVALFPVFVRDEGPLTFVVSPPPGLSVPWLGPVLKPSSPKRRKQEKLNQQFTEGVLEAVDAYDFHTLFGMVGSPEYADPRPYRWEGLRVDPRFNVVLDLTDRNADEILDSFTRDLRQEIRKRDELGVSIDVEGPDEAERICDDLKERHAEQGLTYPTPRAYAGDLVDELDDRARVYVARGPEGGFLGGITILYSNDAAIFWQGGTKANYEGVSVNSLLHWEIIGDILDDPELKGVRRYQLGDANNARIARYKSKFNADLVVNYEVKSDLMVFAKKAYSIRRHLTVNRLRALAEEHQIRG